MKLLRGKCSTFENLTPCAWIIGEAGGSSLASKIIKRYPHLKMSTKAFVSRAAAETLLAILPSDRVHIMSRGMDLTLVDLDHFESIFLCSGLNNRFSEEALEILQLRKLRYNLLIDHVWNMRLRLDRFISAQVNEIICANEVVLGRFKSFSRLRAIAVDDGSLMLSRIPPNGDQYDFRKVLIVMDYFFDGPDDFEQGSNFDFEVIALALNRCECEFDIFIRPHPNQMDSDISWLADICGGVISRDIPISPRENLLVLGVDSQYLVTLRDSGYFVGSVRTAGYKEGISTFYPGIFGFFNETSLIEFLNNAGQ